MKKVFIIHGFMSSPNNIWGPWIMSELKSKSIFTSSLALSLPKEAMLSETHDTRYVKKI